LRTDVRQFRTSGRLSGLGHLVSAFTTVRKHDEGELKLLKLTNKVHDLMQITKLYTVFDIRVDEAEAVKAVKAKRKN
jgi:anti-sigma B factor antagonist